MNKTADVVFPAPIGSCVNMMPIVQGDESTVPAELRGYLPLIRAAAFKPGEVVYLTVTESRVTTGSSNRRPGIHTDATSQLGWGGGWGRNDGIYLASTDGGTRVWDDLVTAADVDKHGSLLSAPKGTSHQLAPSALYHINEYTPHESLPSVVDGHRSFFRLVGPQIGAWYAAHSTPSPFGVLPLCRVVTESKFA